MGIGLWVEVQSVGVEIRGIGMVVRIGVRECK